MFHSGDFADLCVLNKNYRGWYPKSCAMHLLLLNFYDRRPLSFQTQTHDSQFSNQIYAAALKCLVK